jgi:hypothetical protein
MAVVLEKEFKIGKYPLEELKDDKSHEFMRGKAGPYEIKIDKTERFFVSCGDWSARCSSDRLWFSLKEGKATYDELFYVKDGKPYHSLLSLVDIDFFRAELDKGEGSFITLDKMKEILDSYDRGKLKLGKGMKAPSRERLADLRKIFDYEKEINEAASVSEDVQNLKKHPEVVRFMKRWGLIVEPAITEEKAQILAAIESIEKSGRKATNRAIIEHLFRGKGPVDQQTEMRESLNIASLFGELRREGCIDISEGAKVLTDLGREELRKFREKPRAYTV